MARPRVITSYQSPCEIGLKDKLCCIPNNHYLTDIQSRPLFRAQQQREETVLDEKTLIRDLVRMGATGAWAPAEIYQWVPCTRPDRGAILPKSR